MTTKTRSWLITLVILASPFLLFLSFLLFWDAERLPPLAPLPNPNGYDFFLNAGKMAANNSRQAERMNEAQLRDLVEKNAKALSLSRAGFSNQCQVPLQYSVAYWDTHLEESGCLRRLARAFIAEGRLAEMENRNVDAAGSFLDIIHLSDKSAHGGLLIDELVAGDMGALGTTHLQKLVPRLDARTCRETAATLQSLDSEAETWNTIMQQEKVWRTVYARLQRRKISALEARLQKDLDSSCELKFNWQKQQTRQLMVNLAVHAYELEKGHPPASIADLVPAYLKAVPQDPVTGTNLVYSP